MNLVTVGSAFIVTLAAAIFIIRRANNHRKAIAYSRDLEGSSVYFGVSLFSYAELQDATQNFDSSQELGDGGFGTVYYGKNPPPFHDSNAVLLLGIRIGIH